MTQNVLIIGGNGKIGRCVARDIHQQTEATVTITGRKSSPYRDFPFLSLDLNDLATIQKTIYNYDLVVHVAGPFHHRDGRVLNCCLEAGVNYIDVSDHRSFHQQAVNHHQLASKAGITAILHTGVFPGISNLMARKGVEMLDTADAIHLYYLVAGSGGAGLTVMRTTFLGLKSPFSVWINGKWEEKSPYTDREIVNFPHYGNAGVYWFDVAETYTLPQSFPVNTVVTKFGSLPDFYNHLTWISAHRFPSWILQNSIALEGLSRLSLAMAKVTDFWSGIGIAICAEVKGWKDGKKQTCHLKFYHESTSIAVGIGVGSIAQLLLKQEIKQPGVWSVEQAVNGDLFDKIMTERGLKIKASIAPDSE
ncbi:UNVERIFIED_CONTAM: saccharopine dehydrogenase [Euhalothece sp. KZN 001]